MNPIHELFAWDKFGNITSQEYNQLEPALKLASRVLEDQRAVEYVVTCTDGSLHADHPRGSEPGPELDIAAVKAAEKISTGTNPNLLRYPRAPFVQTGPKPYVTDAIRNRARDILKNLAKTVRRIPVRTDLDGAGHTLPTRDPLSPNLLAYFPNSCGRKVMVKLNWDKVFAFQRHPEQSAKALACHYLLARILVHEVAHVLNKAVNGWRTDEIFYQDECCNEAGFAFEQAVFGGCAQFRWTGDFTEHELLEQVVISESWPTKYLIEDYNTPDPALNIRQIQQRWPLHEWSIATRIPWSFITRIFTESFWVHDVPLMGDGPIEPRPKLSWLTKFVELGDVYIDSVGSTVVAHEDGIVVTCSPHEFGNLPVDLQLVYRAILEEKSARRVAGSLESPDS